MRIALLFILLLLNEISLAQDADANWDSYIAMYDKQLPGSTTLNMDLHNQARGDARLRTQPAGGINRGPRAVAAGLSAGGVRGVREVKAMMD